MCYLFEDGDDKDLAKLRTGADGFAEELLKQGTAMYAAKPACMEAVDHKTGEGHVPFHGGDYHDARYKKRNQVWCL